MNRKLRGLFRMLIEQGIEQTRSEFWALGTPGRNFTSQQKDFALNMVEKSGIRATSRILQMERRTLQRWVRSYGIQMPECPDWVSGWAERRRKRREFWQRRGYS